MCRIQELVAEKNKTCLVCCLMKPVRLGEKVRGIVANMHRSDLVLSGASIVSKDDSVCFCTNAYEGGNLRKYSRGGILKCSLYKGIPTESIFKNRDAPTSR